MALVEFACSECSRPISAQALVCPKCGCPVETETDRARRRLLQEAEAIPLLLKVITLADNALRRGDYDASIRYYEQGISQVREQGHPNSEQILTDLRQVKNEPELYKAKGELAQDKIELEKLRSGFDWPGNFNALFPQKDVVTTAWHLPFSCAASSITWVLRELRRNTATHEVSAALGGRFLVPTRIVPHALVRLGLTVSRAHPSVIDGTEERIIVMVLQRERAPISHVVALRRVDNTWMAYDPGNVVARTYSNIAPARVRLLLRSAVCAWVVV